MIIKANSRANGTELARHLLNGHDNEHVEVHAIQGFMADTLGDAFQEAHALSQGTRCTQYLFSVSLSPPQDAHVSVAEFEHAIQRIENKLGLENQPKAIVFHEKNARRHCHVVYSRIDTDTMTAITLPFYKNRLMEISKELYLEHGWKLPDGFIDKEQRNPLNFTLQEWQQAKRLNDDPHLIKLALKECWATSDDKSRFELALEKQGFYLAKGDRRGYVAVDWRGEVYSLSRWLDVKSKDLTQRLGEAKALPSVDDAKSRIDRALTARVEVISKDIHDHYTARLEPLLHQKNQLINLQQQERQRQTEQQEQQWHQETQERQAQLNTGLRALWDRITGKHAQIIKQNEIEAYQSLLREKSEKDALIVRQLQERRVLQARLDDLQTRHHQELMEMKKSVFSRLDQEKQEQLETVFERQHPSPAQEHHLYLDFNL